MKDTYLGVWSKYAVFEGRAGRAEYWTFTLINYAISILLGFVSDQTESGALGVAGIIFLLAIFLPSLAVTVRRFHDTDRSGWFILLGLIPVLGVLIVLVMMLLPGTTGENRFGPPPAGDAISGPARSSR